MCYKVTQQIKLYILKKSILPHRKIINTKYIFLASPVVLYIYLLVCVNHGGGGQRRGVKSLLLGGPILMGMGSYQNVIKQYFIHI